MVFTYSLEVQALKGVPSDRCGPLVLEVIVRTSRLLSTRKQVFATGPIHAGAVPRGMVVRWTQAKGAKATLRLRATAAKGTDVTIVDSSDSVSGHPTVPLRVDEEGLQTAQLLLHLPGFPECQFGEGEASAIPVEVVFTVTKYTGGSRAPPTVPAIGPSAAAANSGLASIHAWAEPAAEPPQPPAQPQSARKRSWLFALGFNRNGGTGSAPQAGSTNGGASAVLDSKDHLGGTSAVPSATPLLFPNRSFRGANDAGGLTDGVTAFVPGRTGMMAAAADQTRALANGGDKMLPWGCAQPASRHERLRLPNALSSGGGAYGAQAGLAAPPGAPAPAPAEPVHTMASPFGSLAHEGALDVKDASGRQAAAAAAATLLPSLPVSVPSSSLSEPQPPKRRRLGDLLARLFSPAAQGQARRVGSAEVTVIDGHSLASPCNAASAASGPGGSSVASAALLAPAAGSSGAQLVAAPSLLRRHASGLGLTPLVPPSPRLGDVYRVQDNAMASDRSVQLGFGLNPPGASGALDSGLVGSGGGGSGASGSGTAGMIVPGLDSPGYGELSPAAGPDRLTVEPPVVDMAALATSTPVTASPAQPPGGCFFWRYGTSARSRAAQQAQAMAVVPAAARALLPSSSGAVPGRGAAGVDSAAPTGAAPPSPSSGAVCASAKGRSSVDRPGVGHQHSQQRRDAADSAAHACSDGAAGVCRPLEAEIGRVVEFINGQTGISDELRALSLSQCQFLLDCLDKPDMCWIVGDSLLQLKHEVGFPFDTGVPIPGASDWYRLVLQPLQPLVLPPQTVQQDQQQQASAALRDRVAQAEGADGSRSQLSTVPAPPPPLPPPLAPEVLKVRWARIDQRQCGGANACAAIALEVSAFCLGAVQRWRNAVAAAAAAGCGCNGASSGRRSASFGRCDGAPKAAPEPGRCGSNGVPGRRELPPLLTRSQRERVAAMIEMEAMTGAALEHCIRTGTAVWQGVLVQSPAARLASSTGDFDLEHMCRLGGYGDKLRLAEYTAASLLESAASAASAGGSSGCAESTGAARTSMDRCSAGGSAQSSAVAGLCHADGSVPAPTASLLFPSLSLDAQQQAQQPGRGSQAQPHGEAQLSRPSRLPRLPPLPLPAEAASHGNGTLTTRTSWQGEVPPFTSLVRKLSEGVYVLGWHGHFATLWLRPGGVVHLIDSLGARLAADCPLAFVLEFSSMPEFLAFFTARYQARRDAAASDDIAGGNMAALVEVHRMELHAKA